MFLAMVTSSCCLQKRNIAGNGESVQSDSRSLDIWQHCSRTDLDKLPGLLLIACVSGHGWSKLITFGHRLSRMCFWPLSHFAAIVLAFFCYLHMFLAILTFELTIQNRAQSSWPGTFPNYSSCAAMAAMDKTCKLAGQGHAQVSGQDHAGQMPQMPQHWTDVKEYWHWSEFGYWWCQVHDFPGGSGGYYWQDGRLGQWSWHGLATGWLSELGKDMVLRRSNF